MFENVAVIGASSHLGERLSVLFERSGYRVIGFSRQPNSCTDEHIEWRQLNSDFNSVKIDPISNWVSAAPIWVLSDYFRLMEASGAKRIVAFSSTSRFTKGNSINADENTLAQNLVDGEVKLQDWAKTSNIEWTILRPTMIYGLGKDSNVSEIARLVSRWHFFPVLGKGHGLRQPIHVEDAAQAGFAALTSSDAGYRSFNISGAEILTLEEMIKRIFLALNLKPRFVHLPRWLFRIALLILGSLPRFKHWSIAMADRMSRDMVFDHSEAKDAFGFVPRSFVLGSKDLPKC
jgi:nucleoside-diphosphate-sugar epimerase